MPTFYYWWIHCCRWCLAFSLFPSLLWYRKRMSFHQRKDKVVGLTRFHDTWLNITKEFKLGMERERDSHTKWKTQHRLYGLIFGRKYTKWKAHSFVATWRPKDCICKVIFLKKMIANLSKNKNQVVWRMASWINACCISIDTSLDLQKPCKELQKAALLCSLCINTSNFFYWFYMYRCIVMLLK